MSHKLEDVPPNTYAVAKQIYNSSGEISYKYLYWNTVLDFIKSLMYTELKYLFYNEIITDGDQKIFFDIDINQEDINKINNENKFTYNVTLDMIGEKLRNVLIMSLIYTFLSLYSILLDKNFLVICKSENPNKYSRHIILNNYKVSNCIENKEIRNLVVSKAKIFLFDSEFSYCINYLDKWIDPGVYRKNGLFRMLYSKKIVAGESSNKEIISETNCEDFNFARELISIWPQNWKSNKRALVTLQLFSTLVKYTEGCQLLPNIVKPKEYCNINTITNAIYIKALELLNQKFPDFLTDFNIESDSNRNRINLKRIRSSDCPICNRTHDSDNSFISISKTSIYLKCYRNTDKYITLSLPRSEESHHIEDQNKEEIHNEELQRFLNDQEQVNERRKRFEKFINKYLTQSNVPQSTNNQSNISDEELFKEKTRVRANNWLQRKDLGNSKIFQHYEEKKYLLELSESESEKEEIVIHKSKLDPLPDQFDTLFINSMMNTGKTFVCSKHVETVKYDSILIITPRQLFAQSIAARFRFSCYLSEDVYDSNVKYKVIQLESIYRLNHTSFDLIIIDEIEAVLNQIFSETNKQFRNNCHMFETLISKANRIICMDAFLSSRSIQVIKYLRPKNSKYSLIKNTYKDDKINGIRLNSIASVVDMAMNLLLNQNKKIVMSWGSKTEMLNFRLALLLNNKGNKDNKIKSVFYYAEAAAEAKNTLADVNQEWIKYDLVCYTPAITVGVNFDVENYFDCKFMVGCQSSVCVRDMIQMNGRVRSAKENLLYYYYPTRLIPHPELTIETDMILFQLVTKEVDYNDKYIEIMSKKYISTDPTFFSNVSSYMAPDWVLLNYIHYIREKNESLLYYGLVFEDFLYQCGVNFLEYRKRKRKEEFDSVDTSEIQPEPEPDSVLVIQTGLDIIELEDLQFKSYRQRNSVNQTDKEKDTIAVEDKDKEKYTEKDMDYFYKFINKENPNMIPIYNTIWKHPSNKLHLINLYVEKNRTVEKQFMIDIKNNYFFNSGDIHLRLQAILDLNSILGLQHSCRGRYYTKEEMKTVYTLCKYKFDSWISVFGINTTVNPNKHVKYTKEIITHIYIHWNGTGLKNDIRKQYSISHIDKSNTIKMSKKDLWDAIVTLKQKSQN